MRRGQTDICAVIAIDKPAGITSHDVVSAVRRCTGERRVGHAGTLDPFATGVLVVCIGPATRLSNYIMAKPKRYTARISFGVATDTDDCDGQAVSSADVPPKVGDTGYAREVLERFTGQISQVPPKYSAKKIDGRRAYDMARSGQEVRIDPVVVTVHDATLLETGDGGAPYWDVSFTVSKGTYIRSLARDIGESVGCGAHLTRLRRVETDGIDVEDAVSLEQFEESYSREWLQGACLNPLELLDLRPYEASEDDLVRVGNGATIKLPATFAECNSVGVVSKGSLYAVYEQDRPSSRKADGIVFKSRLVLPGGVWGA